MTVEQLIQTYQATGTLFTTVNGAPVLYIMPPPPPPTPGGTGGWCEATNAAIEKLSVMANQLIPQAPPDIDVDMERGGEDFGYGDSALAPVAPPVTTPACTMQPPPMRVRPACPHHL